MSSVTGQDFDVVIVGAGLSGLAAADELCRLTAGDDGKTRLRLAVVEARERVGGRTETIHDEFKVDVGAQWIGPQHFELLALSERFNLKLVEQFYPSAANTRLTECVGFKQSALTSEANQAVAGYIAMIDELSRHIEVEHPWTHCKAEEWDHMSVKQHIEAHVQSIEAQSELLLFAQTVLACSPVKISFLFFLFYIKSGGGMIALGDGELGAQRWKVEGGMQQVSARLMQQLTSNHDVTFLFGRPVHRVNSFADTVELYKDGDDHPILRAKRVVFALAPNLLANLHFAPTLPADRKLLGHHMIPGQAAKVLVGFEHAFWLDNARQCSDTAQSTRLDQLFPIHNLFHTTLNGNLPALVGLITGDAAKRFEKLDAPERQIAVERQLRVMYSIPEYVKPVLYLERLWQGEEFSGGCFAGIYPPNGTLTKYGPAIRTEFDKFHFASTETAVEFYGYMEGALRAGKRAAIEVVKYFGD